MFSLMLDACMVTGVLSKSGASAETARDDEKKRRLKMTRRKTTQNMTRRKRRLKKQKKPDANFFAKATLKFRGGQHRLITAAASSKEWATARNKNTQLMSKSFLTSLDH
eukprot:791950-Amphidinium_carterae.1